MLYESSCMISGKGRITESEKPVTAEGKQKGGRVNWWQTNVYSKSICLVL